MTDVVVTVPKRFGLDTWIAEGDPAGAPWSGEEWHFYLYGALPTMRPGERVYVVYNGAIRGYAPLVRIDRQAGGRYGLVRHGDAVACTIPEYIRGFRGWRYRWWEYDAEMPFPDWQNPEEYWRITPSCVNGCDSEGKHQCPKCGKWYCDLCHETFLPIDPQFWVPTAMMCARCHHEMYSPIR